MKEFVWEKYNKINFVDENNLFVGVNLKNQDELNGKLTFIQYGYWYSKNYKGSKLLKYSDINLENYNFDKHFISQSNDYPVTINNTEYNCSQTIFKLDNSDNNKPIFLYLRCMSIDGYYSEGFDFAKFDNQETLNKYNNRSLNLMDVRDYGKKIEGFDLYKSGEI